MEKFIPNLVVADFDGTVTLKVIGKKIVPSLISILREGGVLDAYYSTKAKSLYEKYGSIEKNPNIPEDEKYSLMKEWWQEHFSLLKEKGLTKQHILQAVYHPNIQIRNGFKVFLDILKARNIPLIVFSSSGLGDEAIKEVFKKFGLPLDNVIIISNELKFDKNGKFIGVDEDKILHSMNKKLKDHLNRGDVSNIVKGAKNVLLLGDSLHDPNMLDGMEFDKVFKVGFFLPKEFQEPGDKDTWNKKYDLLLPADADFSKIIELIS